MILASLSVSRGVSTIEPLNKVVVPILLAIVLFSFYWAIFLPYAHVGIEKFFSPNWGKSVPTTGHVGLYVIFVLFCVAWICVGSLGDSRMWLDAITQNAWDTGMCTGILHSYCVAIYTYC